MKEKFKKIKNRALKFQKVVCDNVTRIVLFLEYILIVVPISLLMKLFLRDRLRIQKPSVSSYWKTNNSTEVDYERQF